MEIRNAVRVEGAIELEINIQEIGGWVKYRATANDTDKFGRAVFEAASGLLPPVNETGGDQDIQATQ